MAEMQPENPEMPQSEELQLIEAFPIRRIVTKLNEFSIIELMALAEWH